MDTFGQLLEKIGLLFISISGHSATESCRAQISLTDLKSLSAKYNVLSETRLGYLLHFGNFSKPVATITLPKVPTFLGNFCGVVKIFHFACEIILGQLLWTFGNFLLVTLDLLEDRMVVWKYVREVNVMIIGIGIFRQSFSVSALAWWSIISKSDD